MKNYLLNGSFPSKYDYKNKTQNIDNQVKYFLIKTLTMFKYNNLPDTIPERNMEYILQVNGHACFTKVNEDYYVLSGSLSGLPDAYGEPVEYLVANPYLNFNKSLVIDEDCVLIDSDYLRMGVLPILQKYAALMIENDTTMLVADINCRIQTLLSANDDRTVDSAKEYLKHIIQGDLGVISENQLFDSLKINNSMSKTNFKDLIEYQQYLKASLYNEIGLNANYNMKREKLATAEVEMNSEALYPFIDNMLECRRNALEKINKMYDLDIEVEFNSSWDYRLNNGEPIDTYNEKIDVVDPFIEDEAEEVEEASDPEEETVEDETEETEETEEATDPEETEEATDPEETEEETVEDDPKDEKKEDEKND